MSNEFMVSMANDIREALSRIIKVESQMATVHLRTAHYATATHDILCQMSGLRTEFQTLQTAVTVNTSQPNSDPSNITKLSQNSSSSNDSHFSMRHRDLVPNETTDYCAFESCKECLSQCNRPCSAGMSLKHMLECECCPPNVCRITFILNHMSNFVRAPQVSLHTSNFTLHTAHFILHSSYISLQVCHADTCCYCGMGMGTWSPDVRCHHRRACFIAAKEKCNCPATHDDMVVLLLRLWSNTTHTDVTSPMKRNRNAEDDYQPLSPIIAGRVADYDGNARSDSPQLPNYFD
jgi:hypothetical protein